MYVAGMLSSFRLASCKIYLLLYCKHARPPHTFHLFHRDILEKTTSRICSIFWGSSFCFPMTPLTLETLISPTLKTFLTKFAAKLFLKQLCLHTAMRREAEKRVCYGCGVFSLSGTSGCNWTATGSGRSKVSSRLLSGTCSSCYSIRSICCSTRDFRSCRTSFTSARSVDNFNW